MWNNIGEEECVKSQVPPRCVWKLTARLIADIQNMDWFFLHVSIEPFNKQIKAPNEPHPTWQPTPACQRTGPPPWRSHQWWGVDKWSSAAAPRASEPARYTAPGGRSLSQFLEWAWIQKMRQKCKNTNTSTEIWRVWQLYQRYTVAYSVCTAEKHVCSSTFWRYYFF